MIGSAWEMSRELSKLLLDKLFIFNHGLCVSVLIVFYIHLYTVTTCATDIFSIGDFFHYYTMFFMVPNQYNNLKGSMRVEGNDQL